MSSLDRLVRSDMDGAEIPLFAPHERIYPKAVKGPVRRIKWLILILCLAIYYLLPWVRWDRGPGQASQAVLLDIYDGRFYFFDLEIWPQEIYYLTGLLITGAVTLFLVTSLFGRLWCGYACPQTVWTDLFMWVERLLEGDRSARIRRDAQALSLGKAARKLAKHTIWLLLAAATGGAWIMYYVDAPTLAREFFAGDASTAAYAMAALFTATTYLLAGWAREQVCTYMCPWPRFQSAMFDDQTIIVTYQAWRGEPRGPHKQGAGWDGRGDCIDCHQCQAACPTGIDIRDGVQLECIGCGLCIDACDEIMDKVGRPRQLITWDSLARQAATQLGRSAPFRILRPRTVIYAIALLLVAGAMATALAARTHETISVLPDRAPLFVRLSDGSLRNGYTLKIVNRTRAEQTFELRLVGDETATMQIAESGVKPAAAVSLAVRSDSVGTFRLLVFDPRSAVPKGAQHIRFAIRNVATGEVAQQDSSFRGPPAGEETHGRDDDAHR
jgi:cytochrome c oxidase accessory protein FixG